MPLFCAAPPASLMGRRKKTEPFLQQDKKSMIIVMRKLLRIFLLSTPLLIVASCHRETVLAKVGKTTITASEFLGAYHSLPETIRKRFGSSEDRMHFLQSMIHQKALAVLARQAKGTDDHQPITYPLSWADQTLITEFSNN